MNAQLHLGENAWNPYANIPLIAQDPRTRQSFVNRGKYSQKFCLYRATTYADAIPANGRIRVAIAPTADQGGVGDVEFYQWWAASTGAFAASITNLAMGSTRLMNQPVEASLLFGNGPQVAGKLLQPVFVAATNALDMELTDLSGNANTVRIVGHGCQIADPMNTLGVSQAAIRAAVYNPNVVPYWLTFDNGAQVTVDANATEEFTMTVPSSGDFNAWCLVGRATAPTSLTMEIYEGNRRRLQDGPIRFDQACSTTNQTASLNAASLPFIFNFTHTFQRKTQITIRLVDSSGSNNVVSLCWWGQLVYYPPSPPGLTLATNVIPGQQLGPVPGPAYGMPRSPGLMPTLAGWR